MKDSLTEIAALVRQESGIVLREAQETALSAAVNRAAHGLDPGAFMRATSAAVSGRALIDRLIDEVTVQETTFVRHREQLDTIAWHDHLQRVRAARSESMRVWSAGCATGEEAYTLALLASEAFGAGVTSVDVLGTDISGAALVAAEAGRYRERAVSGLEPALRRRYLEPQADGSYLVANRLRKLVRFRRHNLARGPIPPFGEIGFDLVVCRNVLIYFDPPLVERVIALLERSLRPGGVLLLGAADALPRTAVQSAERGRRALTEARSRLLAGRVAPRERPRSREQQLAAALAAADKGDRESGLAAVASMLADNPLDADAHYIQGLVALAGGDPARAAAAFRSALYTDATFALAAFALGRSYDALGNLPAARRAYGQALRTLDPQDRRYTQLLQQVNLGDIADACRARLAGQA